MPSKASTAPVLAKSIETTDSHLIVVTEAGRFAIPWKQCSAKLAGAEPLERRRAELSPAGYGIHWPLIDEDLAVGPLVEGMRPK